MKVVAGCILCLVFAQAAPAQSPDLKFPKPKTARDLYTQAAGALLSKDIPQATTALSKLVEQFPEDELAPLAAMRLAQCGIASAKYQETIVLLEKWIPELSKSSKARLLDPGVELEAQALLARAYLMTMQYDRVLELVEKVATAEAEKLATSEGQLRALQQIKSFGTAATQRRAAGQAAPLREAAKLVREKRFALAQAELDKVDASLLGADWKWRYRVLNAQCQIGLGKPQPALKELGLIDLAALQPKEQAVVHMLQMEAALAAGSLAIAENELNALSGTAVNDPHQAATLELRRTELALLRKDRDKVDQLASAAKTKYPNFELLHEFDLLRARNMLARIEFDEAQQILNRIIQSPPAHDTTAVPRAQWLLGESYLLSQNYQRAVEYYSQVIDGNQAPTWTESALMQRGKCYEMLGQVAEAQHDYDRLTKEYPASSLSADARARLNQFNK